MVVICLPPLCTDPGPAAGCRRGRVDAPRPEHLQQHWAVTLSSRLGRRPSLAQEGLTSFFPLKFLTYIVLIHPSPCPPPSLSLPASSLWSSSFLSSESSSEIESLLHKWDLKWIRQPTRRNNQLLRASLWHYSLNTDGEAYARWEQLFEENSMVCTCTNQSVS